MNKVIPDSSFTRQCDLRTDQFVLQPERLNTSTPLKGKLTNCHSSGCERPFSVQKIPHSNLILLVVDTLCPCGSKQLDIIPQEVTYPAGLWTTIHSTQSRRLKVYYKKNFDFFFEGSCTHRRMSKERLHRKRPSKCINYHPEEIEIQQCGGATQILGGSAVLLSLIISWLLAQA